MRPGGVRIKVHAAGVNLPDRLVVQGKYQVRPDLPFVPGGEIAGEVLEIGEDVTEFRVGDRVVSFSTTGGYAEEIVVDKDNAFRISDSMSYVQGAGFLVAFATAYHALFDRGRLREGETVAILGAAGAVGTAAIQLARSVGATVIAAASTPDKLAFCKAQGADHLIAYQDESLKEGIRTATGGRGADVIFDLVGGDATQQALSAINWNGRLLVCGFASGSIPSIALNRVLLKGCSVNGVFWGEFNRRERDRAVANHQALMTLFEDSKIRPYIARTYPLKEAAAALSSVSGRQVTGKLVLLTDAGHHDSQS